MKLQHFFALLITALLLAACESGAPPLREGTTTLTISANPKTVDNFGGASTITLRAILADGTPVADGTVVNLTADGGFVASQVTLIDGTGQTQFTSSNLVETVTISAQSGELGQDGSISTTIDVVDGSIVLGTPLLTANPSNLLEIGGECEITMRVVDSDGLPVLGVPVTFSTERGTLRSNGQPVITDRNGLANDRLLLSRLDPLVAAVVVTGAVENQIITTTITITANQSPIPVISLPATTYDVNEAVVFNAASSTDADGVIRTYSWRFGDGSGAEGVEVQHTYTQAGTYLAVLTVEDDLGATQSVSAEIQVSNRPSNVAPVPAFSFSPTAPRAGDEVIFDATASSDSDGSITSYSWQFGDRILANPTTGQVVSHTYDGAGEYTVVLTITDDDGEVASAEQKVTILGNALPTAAFTFTPALPIPGQEVAFDASTSMDTDGNIVRYSWRFGNGGVSSSDSALAFTTYVRDGDFNVGLTVEDDEGGRAFAVQTVTVKPNTPPVAAFVFSPEAPTAGGSVLFDASTTLEGDGAVTTYAWDFGDGGSGFGRFINHTFDTAGSYRVVLSVLDENNLSGEVAQVVTIAESEAPVINLSTSVSGSTLQLDASETFDNQDSLEALNFEFNFELPSGVTLDLQDSEGPVRSGILTSSQDVYQFFVEMIVTDTQANQSRVTRTITVTPGNP
jgi:PKD repeat protein